MSAFFPIPVGATSHPFHITVFIQTSKVFFNLPFRVEHVGGSPFSVPSPSFVAFFWRASEPLVSVRFGPEIFPAPTTILGLHFISFPLKLFGGFPLFLIFFSFPVPHTPLNCVSARPFFLHPCSEFCYCHFTDQHDFPGRFFQPPLMKFTCPLFFLCRGMVIALLCDQGFSARSTGVEAYHEFLRGDPFLFCRC